MRLKEERFSCLRWKDFHVKEKPLPDERPKGGRLVGAKLEKNRKRGRDVGTKEEEKIDNFLF